MGEITNGVKTAIEQIMPYLVQAAEKFGTTADYLWGLQVRQAFVFGIVGVIQYILWIAWCFFTYKLTKHLFKRMGILERRLKIGEINYRQYEEETFGHIGFPLLCTLIAIGSFLIVLPSLKELVTLFVNPEYWALNEVIKLLKGTVNF